MNGTLYIKLCGKCAAFSALYLAEPFEPFKASNYGWPTTLFNAYLSLYVYCSCVYGAINDAKNYRVRDLVLRPFW